MEPHLVNELRRRGYDALSVGYKKTWPDSVIQPDLKFRSTDWRDFYSQVKKLVEDCQIVHFHHCHTSPSISAILLKLLYRKTVVMHAHGNDVRFGLGYATPVRDLALRLADKVLVSTPDLTEHISVARTEFLGQPILLDIFKPTPSEVYTKLHDGVDFVLFHPVDSNRKEIMWIKGTHHVLDALQRIEKEYSVRFVMTHDIPYADMPKFYSAVDVVLDQFFYGSLTCVALEAMACEKPVVTDFRYQQFYSHTAPCMTAKSGDAIYQAVTSLLDDANLSRRIGQQGREFVQAEHSVAKIVDKLLDIYNQILDRYRPMGQ